MPIYEIEKLSKPHSHRLLRLPTFKFNMHVAQINSDTALSATHIHVATNISPIRSEFHQKKKHLRKNSFVPEVDRFKILPSWGLYLTSEACTTTLGSNFLITI